MPQISIPKALLGLLLISQATAHSWVEQLNVIAPNGTLVGQPGFPRGNSPRGAGFNEAQMVHLIPPGRTEVLPTDAMCSQTQRNFEANPVSPRLKASAGQAVALRYQENGHVSLPQNIPGKPQNGGTIFVYGTTEPQPNDALMSIHRVWNAAGTGGDGRGRLLATSNYDDGQCYQINGQQISQQRQKEFPHATIQPQGGDLWCQTDILLPSDLQPGKALTLYWVWDWPTMPGTPGLPQGKQEIYTSCADIEIQPHTRQQGVLNAQSFKFVQQDIGNAAVPAQLQQLGNANAVSDPQLIPFQGQPAVGGSSGGSSRSPAVTIQHATVASQSIVKPGFATNPTTSSANNVALGSSPSPQQGGQSGGRQAGIPTLGPIPGPSQGQGQNGNGNGNRNGNGNGNGNGSGRGGQSQTGNGSPKGDNGTRPPGSAGPGMSEPTTLTIFNVASSSAAVTTTSAPKLTPSPGVFVPGAVPEFGTGTGTSIKGPNNGANSGSNRQAGQQAAADPRPLAHATITANHVPVVTVTQDTQVTVTQFVTIGANQGRYHQSESSISFTTAVSSAHTASESSTTSSTIQRTPQGTTSSIDLSSASSSSSATSRSLTTESSTLTESSNTSISATVESSTADTMPTTSSTGTRLSTSTQELESTTSTTTSFASLVTPVGTSDDSFPIVVVPIGNRNHNRKRQLIAPVLTSPTPTTSRAHPEEAQANTPSLSVRSAAPDPSPAPCSKTHPAYQLRARAPLGAHVADAGAC